MEKSEDYLPTRYIQIINDDLLNAKEDYIVHQCNCVSNDAKTLAEKIFKKYPYANSYKNRTTSTRSIPGTIEIFGNGTNKRFIINAYAQFYPSTNKYQNDNAEKRIKWFEECLNKISEIENINTKTIAMPYNIGCGAGGGNWIEYYKLIRKFARREKIYVTLYKL